MKAKENNEDLNETFTLWMPSGMLSCLSYRSASLYDPFRGQNSSIQTQQSVLKAQTPSSKFILHVCVSSVCESR